MRNTTNLPPRVSTVIQNLMKELSTELDLHYEESDFFALHPTIDVIQEGKKLLEEHSQPVPDVVHHVLRRFRRNHH